MLKDGKVYMFMDRFSNKESIGREFEQKLTAAEKEIE